jgi:NAD(P)-dependent dehydrogenase (short-subunit alcohol dehydrogenase family)
MDTAPFAMDFKQKNIFITGGSRGIGRACAQLFASLGANVIISYKTARKEADQTLASLSKTGQHHMVQLDIANSQQIKEVFDELIELYKRIDVVVNNAGVFLEHKISEVTYTEWQQIVHQTLETNLVGVSNLCYLAARHMIGVGGGKIVNISSRGAFRGEPDHPAYGASKAGLNALSQSLAVALAPHGITVGVVAPGFVETDMAADYLNSEEGEKIKRQSPLNRVAMPVEVARAVAVFAAHGLEFMTGGIVDLNGASYLRS